jgi:hypothetical protein
MIRTIKFIILITGLFISAIVLLSLFFSYETFISHAIQFASLERYGPNIFNLISVTEYHQLQLFGSIVAICMFVIYLIPPPVFSKLWETAYRVFRVTLNYTRQFLFSKNKFVLIIPAITYIIYAMRYPITYDEAWTYINFSSKGIITSLLYYPNPNNHILHSILTSLLYKIPLLGPLVILRLLPVVISLLFWIIAFQFVRRFSSNKQAILVVGIGSMLYAAIFFAFISRGYAMNNLFIIACLFATYNIIQNRHVNTSWFVFTISSILGFFTILTFLYPFLTMSLIILIGGRFQYGKQIISTCIVGLFTFALYFPMIVVNGFAALVNNKYIQRDDYLIITQHFPGFLWKSLNELTGFHPLLIIVPTILSIIALIYLKDRIKLISSLIFIVSPFVFAVVQKVIPFSRTYSYYVLILPLIIFLPWEKYIIRFKPSYLAGFVIAIQLILGFNFYNIKHDQNKEYVNRNIATAILDNKKYLVVDELFDAYLQYYLQINGYKNSKVVFRPDVFTDADTITDYDYVIINSEFDKTGEKKPVISEGEYEVYRVKNDK